MSVATGIQYQPKLLAITFNKDGSTTAGTYLRIGAVVTSNTGFYLPEDGVITYIVASSSATANSSIITLMNRTGVSTRVGIAGAALTMPNGSYQVKGTYSIPVGAGSEISCYLSSGAARSNLIVTVFIEI